jgi:hypothetical protein
VTLSPEETERWNDFMDGEVENMRQLTSPLLERLRKFFENVERANPGLPRHSRRFTPENIWPGREFLKQTQPLDEEPPDLREGERSIAADGLRAQLEYDREWTAGLADKPIEEQVELAMANCKGQFISMAAGFCHMLAMSMEIPEADNLSETGRDALETVKSNPDLAKKVVAG